MILLLYSLVAIPLGRHLPRFPFLEPLHLLNIRHIFASVHVSDLEKSIITTTFVTSFCFRIPLALVRDQSDSSDDRSFYLEDSLKLFHLCLARKHYVFPPLSVVTGSVLT